MHRAFRWLRGIRWPWRRKRAGDAVSNLSTGLWGEGVAASALAERGYAILGRRVRVGRRDELDLVAERDGVLVFVEVKTRRNETYGRPLSAVDRGKRRALCRAAIRYMKRIERRRMPFRFDVVEVIGGPRTGVHALRVVENAFPMDRRYMV